MNVKVYERIERKFPRKITSAYFCNNNGNKTQLKPFVLCSIAVEYDIEGIEHIKKSGEELYAVRFSFDKEGKYTLYLNFDDGETLTEEFVAEGFFDNGYIKVSEKDKRYFSYSNGEPFFSVGINLANADKIAESNNKEFGLSGNVSYIGLKQYERWFKRCSENGVNTARIWLGGDYFNPDTKEAYVFNYWQFSKIDMLLDLAEKYNIKLKLTFEHFRWFLEESEIEAPIYRVFNKELYINGEKCESAERWLNDEKWRDAWLNKISEFAARYSFDTRVFAFELFNEMNCMGEKWAALYNDVIKWNNEMAPKIKKMFPNHFVINSIGSLDSEQVIDMYKRFPFHKFGFMQMHRYLDQGAPLRDSAREPIEAIQTGMNYIKTNDIPFIVAETGAVNNCHSGPFKYYQCDDNGIIFVDTVYTPVFLGSAGCGNIWHWGKEYVESKNLYKYFKPLYELTKDTDFLNEEFVPIDYSDKDVYIFVLKGKTESLCFVRNKSYNWYNVLRDLNEPLTVSEKTVDICGEVIVYPIWEEDTTLVKDFGGKTEISNIKYGTLFKIK